MNARSPLLEDFAPGATGTYGRTETDPAAALQAAWSEGYEAGARQGAEAAAKEAEEDRQRVSAALVEAVRDLRLGHGEVQAQVIAGVAPLIAAAVGALAPKLALAGLADRAADAVAHALATRPNPIPILACAPESHAAVAAALAEANLEARVHEDPRLTPLEAEIRWDDGFDRIDLTALLELLDRFVDETLATGAQAEHAWRHPAPQTADAPEETPMTEELTNAG
ncbi:MAG: hypothetical protein AAFV62_06560 [Pseudomonadota bacterium]